MKVIEKIVKWILYLLAIPIAYVIIAFILTEITVDRTEVNTVNNVIIYLNTNGVHLNVVLPKNAIDINLLKDLEFEDSEKYISFGWGDENFYINTPTWGDLTFKNAFTAMFLESMTLIHLTRYKNKKYDWVEVKINKSELDKLNKYILNSFKKDKSGNKIILQGVKYSTNDNFYKANGSYSCFNNCNTWVNSAFKESGLKSCYWTPFDFGLINKYK